MCILGLLRISAVEFSISQPLINGLMYQPDPDFIPRPLLHKAQLSDRNTSVAMLKAVSRVVVTAGDFTGVATSPATAAAPLAEPQEVDTAKHRHQIFSI
jgi:hypothetical protein